MPEFLVENDNEIIRNVKPPELFVPDSFEAMPVGFDVTLIIGSPASQDLIQELINPEKKIVQAVKFAKPGWNMEEALAWLQENQKHFSQPKELKKYANELKQIKGVEIFSAGVWNGDSYSVEDLEEMVKAFNENEEGFRPPLKLGHSDNQALIQNDGMPAAGWVGGIYVQGEKLLADFIDIPKKIFELIDNKAYRKVSSEIFWNIKLGEKLYKRALAAVALLGADNPAVSNLSDILANYNLDNYNSLKVYNNDFESKIYNQEDRVMPKTEKEILEQKALEDKAAKADELAKQVKKFTDEQTKKDKELADLKAYKAEQDTKIAEAQAEAKAAKQKQYVQELKNEKLCTPAMEKYINELLSDKKVYSVDDKETSKEEVLKEMLKLFKQAAEVNFDENSLDGEKKKNNSETEIEKKIADYEKEHKVDYSTAYRAIHNDMQVEDVSDEDEE